MKKKCRMDAIIDQVLKLPKYDTLNLQHPKNTSIGFHI